MMASTRGGTYSNINRWVPSGQSWIDIDIQEPLMNTVMPELMLAIWKHLRPSPYIYGPVALRILGKLGGRNRNCIRSPLELTCKENPENGLRLVLTFEPGIHFMLPVDEYVQQPIAVDFSVPGLPRAIVCTEPRPLESYQY